MKKCSFCGNKNIKNNTTEYTYKHNGKYLLINNVPCKQCEFCGEKYFEAKVLRQIEEEFLNIQSGKKKVSKELIIPFEDFTEMVIAS